MDLHAAAGQLRPFRDVAEVRIRTHQHRLQNQPWNFPDCLVDYFFNDPAPTEIYTSSHTLSLHDALPISIGSGWALAVDGGTFLVSAACLVALRRSEEHTSELQSRELISYAVFCLKK